MTSTRRLQDIQRTFVSARGSVLSIYARVPPGSREDLAEHVKVSLDGVDAPPDLVARARSVFSRPPRGRTVALFVAQGADEQVRLDVELPVAGQARSELVEARVGEQPWLLPLEKALGRTPPTAVVYVDRERCRMFRAHMGQAEELEVTQRIPHEGFETTPAPRQGPAPGGEAPARDDAHHDRKQRHEAHLRDQMYREVVERLNALVDEEGAESILVVGTAKNVAAFLSLLPVRLADRAVAGGSSFPDPDLAPERIPEVLRDDLEGIAKARQQRRLDALRESGRSGLESVLEAAQEGRAERIVVPWVSEAATVYRAADGFMTTRPERARALDRAAGPVDEIGVDDALAELAPRFGIAVEAVDDEASARLKAEHEGIAALLRW